MKKYWVCVSTVAYMSQVVEVEASSKEEAEDIVFEKELWNNGEWENNGITTDTPELNYVEEAN